MHDRDGITLTRKYVIFGRILAISTHLRDCKPFVGKRYGRRTAMIYCVLRMMVRIHTSAFGGCCEGNSKKGWKRSGPGHWHGKIWVGALSSVLSSESSVIIGAIVSSAVMLRSPRTLTLQIFYITSQLFALLPFEHKLREVITALSLFWRLLLLLWLSLVFMRAWSGVLLFLVVNNGSRPTMIRCVVLTALEGRRTHVSRGFRHCEMKWEARAPGCGR